MIPLAPVEQRNPLVPKTVIAAQIDAVIEEFACKICFFNSHIESGGIGFDPPRLFSFNLVLFFSRLIFCIYGKSPLAVGICAPSAPILKLSIFHFIPKLTIHQVHHILNLHCNEPVPFIKLECLD
jgi:hypothetical protein